MCFLPPLIFPRIQIYFHHILIIQIFDNLNSTRPSPARRIYLKNNKFCRKPMKMLERKAASCLSLRAARGARALPRWAKTAVTPPSPPSSTFSGGRVGIFEKRLKSLNSLNFQKYFSVEYFQSTHQDELLVTPLYTPIISHTR